MPNKRTYKLQKGLTVGQYVFERVLQEDPGAMSTVILAVNPKTQHRVVFKVARVFKDDPERQAMCTECLDNEVEILRQLAHSGVVAMEPLGGGFKLILPVDGEPWCFVMEYLAGGSLAQLMSKMGRMPVRVAGEIAWQIGHSLWHVHQRRLAHCDVKPANILFRKKLTAGEPPEAVLIDFGTARDALTPLEDRGTLDYASPERLRLANGEFTHAQAGPFSAWDVYSLGIVLYRMVTGRLPFSGHKESTTQRILNDTPAEPIIHNGTIPKPLNDLIMQCLEKEPWKRPTMEEFLGFLEEAVPDHAFIVEEGPSDRRLIAALPVLGIAVVMLLRAIPPWGPGDPASTPIPTSTAAPGVVAGVPVTAARVVIPSPTEAIALSTPVPAPLSTAPITLSTPVPTPTPTWRPAATSVMYVSTGGDGVYIRNAPDLNARVKVWPDGTRMEILGKEGDWCYVRAPDGYLGFVPAEYLAVKAPPTTATPVAPVPGRAYPAPVLKAPGDKASFTGKNARVVTSWESVGALGPDEYYVVKVPHSKGEDWQWTKETQKQLPDYLLVLAPANWELRWTVTVYRYTGPLPPEGSNKGTPVGQESSQRTFTWKPEDSPGSPYPVRP